MASKVAFITNSGGKFGLGHLSRCGSIAGQLVADGHDVQIILGKESKHTEHETGLASMVHRLDKELFTTDQEGFRRVQTDLLRKLEAERPDAVFLDSYQIDPHMQANINDFCQQIIVIDDLASKKFSCRHLINYAPTITETDYSGHVTDSTELHLGLKFFPLSETLRSQKAETNRQNYLAVCLGGSDSSDITKTLVRQLQRCDMINEFAAIVVINGLTARDQAELDLGDRFRVLAQPPNYTKLIADARLAITGAGVSALERLYLEIPGIVMITAENQRPNFNYLTESGLFSGYEPEKQGVAELNELIRDGLTHPISNAIIDGLGATRIAALINKGQAQG